MCCFLRPLAASRVSTHLIGVAAADSGRAEGRAFARAASRYGVIGASMYDQSTMGQEDWRALRSIRLRGAGPSGRPP
jgi:hypothetical protein